MTLFIFLTVLITITNGMPINFIGGNDGMDFVSDLIKSLDEIPQLQIQSENPISLGSSNNNDNYFQFENFQNPLDFLNLNQPAKNPIHIIRRMFIIPSSQSQNLASMISPLTMSSLAGPFGNIQSMMNSILGGIGQLRTTPAKVTERSTQLEQTPAYVIDLNKFYDAFERKLLATFPSLKDDLRDILAFIMEILDALKVGRNVFEMVTPAWKITLKRYTFIIKELLDSQNPEEDFNLQSLVEKFHEMAMKNLPWYPRYLAKTHFYLQTIVIAFSFMADPEEIKTQYHLNVNHFTKLFWKFMNTETTDVAVTLKYPVGLIRLLDHAKDFESMTWNQIGDLINQWISDFFLSIMKINATEI